MKKFYYLFLSLFLCAQAIGQQPIVGKVVDSITGEPVVGASVYVANTSFGTFTDIAGEFQLKDYPKNEFQLNISSIGYQTIVVTIPSNQKEYLKIKLKQNTIKIEAVTVFDVRENLWPRYGKLFKELIFSESEFSEKCQIKNEKDIILYIENGKLKAFSKKPIAIENKALGYEIEFWLELFEYSLDSGMLTYLGYPFFKDQNEDKKKAKIIKNRRDSYNGSMVHFLQSVLTGDHTQAGFEAHLIEKRSITELYPKSSIQIDTIGYSQQETNKLATMVNTERGRKRLVESFNRWKIYSTDSLFRVAIYDNHETLYEGAPIYFEFLKPTKAEDYFVLKRYTRDSTIEKKGYKGLYELVKASHLSTSDFTKTIGGDVFIEFPYFLRIVYLHEKQEREYYRSLNNNGITPNQNQTSTLHLFVPNGIAIYEEGILADPYSVFIEGYWTYERLDKMLPLNYIPIDNNEMKNN